MSDLQKFRSLEKGEKLLVAVAVLLDGHDAPDYLVADEACGLRLSRAAKDIAELPPDIRMPLLGTLIRELVEE